MSVSVQKYLNLLLDYGFKKLFGEESNKRFLISFLNALLQDPDKHIKDLKYSKTENQGDSQDKRLVIFDILCHGENGAVFLIEIQRVKQNYFKNRAIYYAARQISSQSEKGREWEYNFTAVYVIAILGHFSLNGDRSDEYLHDIALRDHKSCKLFDDKIRFIFIELLNFTKSENELKTELDKWLFALKHMSKLAEIPETFTEEIFKDFFKTAEILTDMERTQEEIQQKIEWDHYAILQTAKREGIEEGMKEGLKEGMREGIEEGLKEGVRKGIEEGLREGEHRKALDIARNLKLAGASLDLISTTTKLPVQQIQRL